MESPEKGEYDAQQIEAKWRHVWAETAVYRTPAEPHGRTTYCLEFFPYPSGEGLSVGHGRNYVPTDVYARYRRMQGDAVLHPMGWDAFGLPAENAALKRGIHPAQWVRRNVAVMKKQKKPTSGYVISRTRMVVTGIAILRADLTIWPKILTIVHMSRSESGAIIWLLAKKVS